MNIKIIITGLSFSLFMSWYNYETDCIQVQDCRLDCKEIVIKSLRGLYRKGAINIESGYIYLRFGYDDIDKYFQPNEEIIIDGKYVRVCDYTEGTMHVNLFFTCKENITREEFSFNWRSQDGTGTTYFGTIYVKYIDSLWTISHGRMISSIE
jgi:hypothetical protein